MINMKKRILIIGQCSLHWGRMEFGNIGNYYIVEPMFEELRRVFPDVQLATTMQFSQEFCHRFDIITVPLEYYYDFSSEENLEIAKKEYLAVQESIPIDSGYIEEVKKADFVIDFSGDIWGDNADFLGKDRFLTGLYKDRIAQVLKPTVMICGSPGPFNGKKDIEFVKEVFAGFALVINREHISTRLLRKSGFAMSHVKDYACPSFLFKRANLQEMERCIGKEINFSSEKLKIGMVLCGWNFERGPFDLWPRNDNEFAPFITVAKNCINKYDAELYLLSHSNGFDVPPSKFVLKQGRDFPIVKRLKELMDREGYSEKVKLLDGVYSPAVTKGIISKFDMLISGRMHAAVAGLSQSIPTVIIDYGHEPKAHKLRGFAEIAGVEDYIADPNSVEDLLIKTEKCIENRQQLHCFLQERMISVQKNIRDQFDYLREFADSIEES